MNKQQTLYHLENIDHGYNQFRLKIPDFTIESGVSLGLSGPNGSGKSTLLRLLAFLETPESGRMNFIPQKGGNRSVTLLQQDPYLLKRSVFDNVCYGLKIRGDIKDLKKRVYESLETVNLDPDKFAPRWWHELSGGEAQRVALASRIILNPKVLLLDEPVANVDTESAAAISGAIKKMRTDFSTTLIISSHDLSWLTGATDIIWKLHDGRLTGTGNVNIIGGPWQKERDNIWSAPFSGNARIFASPPPDEDSIGILDPHDIMISEHHVDDISALNSLKATIRLMVAEEQTGRIRIEADVSGRMMNIYITEESARKMNILPGRKVFIIFKATAIEW